MQTCILYYCYCIYISVNESTAPMVQTNPGKERTESSAHSKSTTEQGREGWEINSRLPEFLLPLHYDLYLHPDLEDGTFKGNRQNLNLDNIQFT